MPAVKALDRISAKWARVAAVSEEEYRNGIENPRKDWATETAKAEASYKTGVTQAATAGRFGKGVKRVGTSKWRDNSLQKGPSRWSQGISLSTLAYEKGFAPFRDALERLKLPERGPKGDPKNIQRVAAVAKALHDKKLEMGG